MHEAKLYKAWCRASIDGTFYNFSVTRIVRMIRAKNYQKFSKFVKVTAKILSVSFFWGGGTRRISKELFVKFFTRMCDVCVVWTRRL